MPKQTAYEKILPLVRLHPDSAYMRTALRHFDDAAILRECQKREAKGTASDEEKFVLNRIGDADLIEEWRRRDMDARYTYRLELAYQERDWKMVSEVLDDMGS